MITAIVIGAALSWSLASPQIAVASIVAFTASEVVDSVVYSRIRVRSRLSAVLGSNVVGLVTDSVLFVPMAFGSFAAVPAQILRQDGRDRAHHRGVVAREDRSAGGVAMKFYLGTHQPAWLARDLGVPLLVSHRRLASRRSLPRATGPWACDSGGVTELSLYGRWRTDERSYIAALRRYATEISHLEWAAPMDHMTEQHILARTGGTVRIHQNRTVANFLRLRDLAPELPIIPVLQGQSIADYNRCADFYERHGVDLAALPLVGVGSVCRRQHTAEVEQIMRSLAARGYRLHAFGANVLGLGRYADAISSSDSASWSLRGRYVPGCSPSHRSESNCLRFAMAWHARLLTSLRTEEPGHRSADCTPTSPGTTGSRTRGEKEPRTRPGLSRPRSARGRTTPHTQNSTAA